MIDFEDEKMRKIAGIVGPDLARRLLDEFAGTNVYFPKAEQTALRRKKVCDEFDGHNAASLAVKNDVSLSTVYQWVRPIKASKKAHQMSFLD
jgi:Mor family transcriptional regulator